MGEGDYVKGEAWWAIALTVFSCLVILAAAIGLLAWFF